MSIKVLDPLIVLHFEDRHAQKQRTSESESCMT